MRVWHVVFLGGRWEPAGAEGVVALCKDRARLAAALAAEPTPFVPRPVPFVAQPHPRLLHQAGGGPWATCQTRIYGNVLRVIALLQVCLLVPAHALRGSSSAASTALLCVVGLDATLFCLAGPTPFTPLGCAATALVWRRRGSVAPLLPYKFTFALLYAFANAAGLACRSLGEEREGGAVGELCGLVNADGITYTMMVNSVVLGVLRF